MNLVIWQKVYLRYLYNNVIMIHYLDFFQFIIFSQDFLNLPRSAYLPEMYSQTYPKQILKTKSQLLLEWVVNGINMKLARRRWEDQVPFRIASFHFMVPNLLAETEAMIHIISVVWEVYQRHPVNHFFVKNFTWM